MAKISRKNDADDYAFRQTDKDLKELESRLSSLYSDATKEMEAKLNKFTAHYAKADAEHEALYQAGKITKNQLTDWRQGKVFMTKKMQAQIDSLAEDMVNTDKMAMQIVNGEMPRIYVLNYNFQGYRAETMAKASGIDYTSFTIYNADAIARIAKENPDLLPAPNPKIDIPKDRRWNRQKINSAIQQGILQGEPVTKIADRLQQVTDMDKNAAIRNARTALIGAQNSGRNEASKRVNKSGIEMVDTWAATYDARTRDTHLDLDGQERAEDGFFHTFRGNKLEYPADRNCRDASEVYNCRCRLNSFIKGIDHSKDDELHERFMKENYYEDWLRAKEKEADHSSRTHAKTLEKEYAKEKKALLSEKYPRQKAEKSSDSLRRK